MRPLVDYGYRDTVFFQEQPKILDINHPFIDVAYELNYGTGNDSVIGGSIFLNDAYSLSFVQDGPEGERPYYVAEKAYIVGTPEYPQGIFVPFSASADTFRMTSKFLNLLADLEEETEGQSGEFFEYEDFK